MKKESKKKWFIVFYNYKGKHQEFDIPGSSWDDAESRLQAIKHNSRVEGEIMATIPAAVGWWVPMVTAVRNFFCAAFKSP